MLVDVGSEFMVGEDGESATLPPRRKQLMSFDPESGSAASVNADSDDSRYVLATYLAVSLGALIGLAVVYVCHARYRRRLRLTKPTVVFENLHIGSGVVVDRDNSDEMPFSTAAQMRSVSDWT